MAMAKTVSVAMRAFSFSPKLTAALRAEGLSIDSNLLREVMSESITGLYNLLTLWTILKGYSAATRDFC